VSTGRYIERESLLRLRSIIDLADLVGDYAKLKRVGSNFQATCPFPDHAESKPSFYVNSEKGVYTCFGCNRHGDAISFLMEMEGLTFNEAVVNLAQRYQVELVYRGNPEQDTRPRQALRILEEAKTAYHSALLELPRDHEVWAYTRRRGLSEEVIRELQLGYAPEGWQYLVERLRALRLDLDLAVEIGLLGQGQQGRVYDFLRHRLVFPLVRLSGSLLGFGGRALSAEVDQKYVNPRESFVYQKREHLYGLHLTRHHVKAANCCVVVEGYMDFVSLYARGVKNVVAALGTALTAQQLELIRRFTDKVVLCFDGDRAGVRSMERNLPPILQKGLQGFAVDLPDGEDPDSVILKHGQGEMVRLIERARPLLAFYIDHRLNEEGGAYGRNTVAREVLKILREVPSRIDRKLAVEQAGRMLDIPESFFSAELGLVPEVARRRKERTTDVVPGNAEPEIGLLQALLQDEELVFEAGDLELVELVEAGPVHGALERLVRHAAEHEAVDAKVLLDEAEGTPEQAVLRAALFPDQRLGSSDPRQLYRACLDLLVRRAVERHFAELNREVARSLSAREQEDGTTSELKNLLERQGELRRCMARLKERPPGELEVRELVGLVRGVVGA